jgi:signal transduction histidine kinase
MTRVGDIEDQNEDIILREVIHLLAKTPHLKNSVPFILDKLCNLASANGCGYLIFDEPRLLISLELGEIGTSLDQAFLELASNLKPGVHANPATNHAELLYDNWILCHLVIKNETIGVVWLVFDSEPELAQSDFDAIQTLVDCLIIVSKNIRSDARREKLGRNQSEFMRIVSHDLRSPLTSIQGFASMLESGMVGDMNEKQLHFANKILSGIDQLTKLVDNFHDAGRYDPETGFYELERTQCDLVGVVQTIIQNHLLPAEKQELTLNAVIGNNVPIISADVNMLERALTNLVDNAIKYTPNGRNIEVGVHSRDGQILLSVKDNGLGISPEHQPLLFERHVRIPRKEHKRIKGSGLGLFIVRSVARRHGGEAWVESVEGEGSAFYISIPLNEVNSLIIENAVDT